jgi:hypothetical protein
VILPIKQPRCHKLSGFSDALAACESMAAAALLTKNRTASFAYRVFPHLIFEQ